MLTNKHNNTYRCFHPFYVLMEVANYGRSVFSCFLRKIGALSVNEISILYM